MGALLITLFTLAIGGSLAIIIWKKKDYDAKKEIDPEELPDKTLTAATAVLSSTILTFIILVVALFCITYVFPHLWWVGGIIFVVLVVTGKINTKNMKINQEKVIASLDSIFLKKQPEPKNEDEDPIKEAAEESGLWTTFKRKRPSSTREASYKESLLKKTYE